MLTLDAGTLSTEDGCAVHADLMRMVDQARLAGAANVSLAAAAR